MMAQANDQSAPADREASPCDFAVVAVTCSRRARERNGLGQPDGGLARLPRVHCDFDIIVNAAKLTPAAAADPIVKALASLPNNKGK